MTRDEMLERMSMEEFLGWMAYAEIEPFGDEREDLRAGLLWSAFCTANSDRKKHPNGIAIDKYPLLKMREELNRPDSTGSRKTTSKGLFDLLKAMPKAGKKVRKPS